MKAAALCLIVASVIGTRRLTEHRSSMSVQTDSLARQVGVLTRQVSVLTRQMDVLARRVYATQDSISRLWAETHEFARVWAFDTIIPPPKCPPNCPRMELYRAFPPPPIWANPDTSLFH